MDSTTAKQMIKDKTINGNLHVLESANHNLFIDNPTGFTYIIVKDVFGPSEADKFLASKPTNK